MKRLLILFSLLFLLSYAGAQTTTVSGTVTDPDGQAWANGNWTTQLIMPAATSASPMLSGVPVDCVGSHQCTSYNGVLDGAGTFSQVLASNNQITPSGTLWRFTICPNASSNCVSTTISITGASQTVSSALNAVAARPQVTPQPNIGRAYRDAEITTPYGPGQVWLDVTLNVLKYIKSDLTIGTVGTGGGGGTPGGTNTQFQFNDSGAFGGATLATYNKTTGESDISNLSNVIYVTPSYNWSNSPAGTLTGGVQATVTLPSGIVGIDVTNTATAPYYVYVSAVGTPEAVLVTGGTYTTSGGGTIIFTPVNSHSAGFAVGSASTGIVEAINSSGVANGEIHLMPSGTSASTVTYIYNVYADIVPHKNNLTIWGGGATLNCQTTGACIKQWGFGPIHIHNIRFATSLVNAGAAITDTSCAANVATITTTLNPPVGSQVDVQNTFRGTFLGIHTVTTTSPTSWTFTSTNCGGFTTLASDSSIGGNDYEQAAIEVGLGNTTGNTIDNILIGNPGGVGISGKFNNGIINYNDQNAKLTGYNAGVFACTAAYCGSAVYLPGPFATAAGLFEITDSNISLQCAGNGITNYAGNTLGVVNTVIQGYAEWGVSDGQPRGGFGAPTLVNVYMEVGICTNPLYNPSIGAQAGLIHIGNAANRGPKISGGEAPGGTTPNFGTGGGTTFDYYVVPIDSTFGKGFPLYIGFCSTTPTCTIQWPRIAATNTGTYDILRTQHGVGGTVAPFNGGCLGGSTTACGSVALAVAQCSTYTCSLSDNVTVNTATYTVSTFEAGNKYIPRLNFWPGNAVLSPAGNTNSMVDGIVPVLFADNAVTSVISAAGAEVPAAVYGNCVTGNGPALLYEICLQNSQSIFDNRVSGATVINDSNYGGSETAGWKGRLIFNHPNGTINNTDIITLVDFTGTQTRNTSTHRPAASASDAAICYDSGSIALTTSNSICFRAKNTITNYINTLGDNSSWLERLTSTTKTLKVPLTISSASNQLIVTPGNSYTLNFANPAASRVVTVNDPLAAAVMPLVTGAITNGNCAKFSGTTGIIVDNGTACGGLTGLTTNRLLKAATASTATNSSISDDGTTVSTAEVIQAASFIATSGGWTVGTIASVGNVLCPSANSTVSDCSHTTPAQNNIGVATGTAGTIYPQINGFATLNYDATVSPSAGWFACISAVTDGKVLVQAAVCPAGQRQIGIVAVGGTNVTSGSVWLKAQ